MIRMRTVLLLAASLLLLAACGGAQTQAPAAAQPPTEPATEQAAEQATEPAGAEAAEPQAETAGALEADLPDFGAAVFGDSTTIDNQWFPLTPGTRFVYEGTTIEDDGTAVPHRVEITVTDLTKVIGGVRTLATWDLDFSDDELVEEELAFYAQDDAGNVWRMGEFPVEYDGGEIVAAPTWMHGLQEAQAGIHMPGDPQPGTPSYAQGWGPAVDWTDRGQVDEFVAENCVPADCYQNVLVIAETSASEPDAQQLKYFAPGVGNVRVGWRGEGEKTKETLELTELAQLSPEEMAEARDKAMALDAVGVEVSADVYALTGPLEPLGSPSSAAEGEPQAADATGSAPEVVVYASDLPESALYEFEVWEDAASPGGTLLGVPNFGGDLDPPPENDPNVLFTVPVAGGVPYRCWVHMNVGAPRGVSQANKLWVQFTDSVDESGAPVLRPDTDSYLTAQGPAEQGWAWVGCNLESAGPDGTRIYFAADGETTVRIQAGMEGVGFDQFILSPAAFLDGPPGEPVVAQP